MAATLVSAWLAASAGSARTGEAPPAEAVADANAADRDTAARAGAERTAAPRQADAAATGARLRGLIHDEQGGELPGVAVVVRNTLAGTTYEAITGADGTFAFDGLPVGTYDLEATLEGFAIEVDDRITLRAGVQVNLEITATFAPEVATMGVVVAVAEPLRRLFDDSELVVVAVAGPSFVAEGHDRFANVATELRIETVVKGPAELQRISYRHDEYGEVENGGADLAGELVPGTRVLAFLTRSSDEAFDRRAPAFAAVDYESVKLLSEAELTAYLRRIEALQRIEVRAARRGGEHDPEDLVEWLVGTIEDPLTRNEATGELARALDALAERAESSAGTPELAAAELLDIVESFRGEGGRMQAEPPPFVLGAFVTDDQRERLTAALVATAGLRDADRQLFWLVRRWDEAKAMAWLGAQLGKPVDEEEDEEELQYWLQMLVDDEGDAALAAIVAEAGAREEEIAALWPADETNQTEALRKERLKAVRERLRHELAAALSRPR